MTLYPPTTTIPIYSVFLVTGIILTCLRLHVRLRYTRSQSRSPLHLDDLFIFLALLILASCTAIQFYNSLHGGGGEAVSSKFRQSQILVEHKVDFTMIVIEKPGFGFVKLSLLFFYRRLFGHWESFRRWNNGLIWIVSLWTVAFFVADLLLCGAHPELQWGLDQRLAATGCGDKGALLIAFAATSVVTDAAVLVLPLPYVGRLRLGRGKKVAACGVFLLGGISTMAGVLRLTFLSVAYPTGRLNFGYKAPPHSQMQLVLRVFNPTFWVMVEFSLGVWAANLPVLAPLIRAWNQKYKESSVYRKMSASGSSNASGSVTRGKEERAQVYPSFVDKERERAWEGQV